MNSETKQRLLVIGDGGVGTGFARVTESILSRLKDRYEIHHLACNYRGDPHCCAWSLYPAILGGDPFGVGRVSELVKKLKPELIWTVNDLWFQQQYLELIFAAEPDAHVVTYSPVDAAPVDHDWLQLFHRAKACVFYTEFGKREAQKALPKGTTIHSLVIPHGVDSKAFFPIDSSTAKLKIGIIASPDEESFVVLNANRNQPRKRIDLTIEGFARFAADKPPSVKLLLHMGQKDIGWDVVKVSRRYGVEERIILTGPPDGSRPSIQDSDLNFVYNSADVGLNTAGGEGWGLPAFEHAATGKAQIVPKHSACVELWAEAAVILDVHDRCVQPSTLTEFCFTRPDDVDSALECLYIDSYLRKAVATKCFETATRTEYQWDAIAKRWDEVFQRVVS